MCASPCAVGGRRVSLILLRFQCFCRCRQPPPPELTAGQCRRRWMVIQRAAAAFDDDDDVKGRDARGGQRVTCSNVWQKRVRGSKGVRGLSFPSWRHKMKSFIPSALTNWLLAWKSELSLNVIEASSCLQPFGSLLKELVTRQKESQRSEVHLLTDNVRWLTIGKLQVSNGNSSVQKMNNFDNMWISDIRWGKILPRPTVEKLLKEMYV